MGLIEPVTVELLDGNTYTFREDFNAYRAFDAETGRDSLNEDVLENVDAQTLVAWVWALCRREHPDLTVDDVGALIDPSNFQAVYEACHKQRLNALKAAGIVDEEAPGDAEGEASPSDGSSSGPSDATTSD